MTHDLQQFRDITEKLEATFSDLFGNRSYIVRVSETSLKPNRTSEHGFNGLASPFLSRLFRDDVPRVTEAGPCILLDDADFESPEELTAIACHEFAHIACEPIPFARDSYVLDGGQKEKFVERVESPDLHFATQQPPSNRDDHGANWLRLMLHLAYRLRRAGHRLHLRECCNMRIYGYRPLIDYDETLGDEPYDLRDVPILDLKHTPIPPAFLALWHQDCALNPE